MNNSKTMPIESRTAASSAPSLESQLAQLHDMLTHAEEVAEIEKLRLARELHNDFGSALTALAMRLAILSRQPAGTEGSAEQWAKANAILAGLTRTARRIQGDLRPGALDVVGLPLALEEYLHEFEAQTGMATAVALPLEEPALRQQQAVMLFRMFQELLANVRQHSGAGRVDVKLECCSGGRLVLAVTDNGCGFDTAGLDWRRTHGLRRINERAILMGGCMQLDSMPGAGTTVRISLPIAEPEANTEPSQT